MTAARSFGSDALRASSGIIVWAIHFAVIYGFTALACDRGFAHADWVGAGPVTWVVLGATAVSALLLVWLMRRLLQQARHSFIDWLGAGVAGLALIGVLYEAVPVLLVVPCV
jgi:hypothetical protein